MSTLLSDQQLQYRGHIQGFVVQYFTTTTVEITAGLCEANGKIYVLDFVDTFPLSGIVLADDFHYIYIDDAGSAPPSPSYVDSTTEPVYDDIKLGWYNGNDRCIGVLESPNLTTIIEFFSTRGTQGKYVESTIGRSTNMASNMNPNATWQAPNIIDGSGVTPVNATTIALSLNGEDPTSTFGVYATNAESSVVKTSFLRGTFEHFGFNNGTLFTGFMPLGASRNIRITGQADDDNALDAWVFGYGYNR